MKIKLIIAIVILMLSFSLQAMTHAAEIEIKGERTIRIDLKSGGNIYVEGEENRTAIRIQARAVSGEFIDPAFIDIGRDEQKINIRIRDVKISSRNIQWIRVLVPLHINLEVKTVAGNLKLENINGTIIARTLGGDILLTDIIGIVRVKTLGGNIKISDSKLDGTAITLGGSIVFNRVTGAVKGISPGGTVVRKDNGIAREKKREECIRIETKGGDIDINRAPNGAIVRTHGGNINIRKASRFVRGTTDNGNIDVQALNGTANLKTNGGNIFLRMVSGSTGPGEKQKSVSTLECENGNIVLILPPDLSFQVIARQVISHQNRSSKNHIYSDFPIRKRKILTAGKKKNYRYLIQNGGKQFIRFQLQNKNGYIYIKKEREP